MHVLVVPILMVFVLWGLYVIAKPPAKKNS